LILFHHDREGSFGAESQEISHQMAKIDFPFKGPVETNAGVPKFWKTLTQAFVDRQTHSPFPHVVVWLSAAKAIRFLSIVATHGFSPSRP
jgi:hypothetical protein